MKSYSQKQTNGAWASRGANGRFVSRSQACSGKAQSLDSRNRFVSDAHRSTTNKFEGMAEGTELLQPVHIPGYKIRG